MLFIHRIHPSPRLMSIFCSRFIFYGDGLLALRPTPKLEDHPLSFVCSCLFNVFAATFDSFLMNAFEIIIILCLYYISTMTGSISSLDLIWINRMWNEWLNSYSQPKVAPCCVDRNPPNMKEDEYYMWQITDSPPWATKQKHLLPPIHLFYFNHKKCLGRFTDFKEICKIKICLYHK
jgi:hypothetical protein